MHQHKLIHVEIEDEQRLMNECKELFLEDNPTMKGLELSRKFLFKKVIDWYLK